MIHRSRFHVVCKVDGVEDMLEGMVMLESSKYVNNFCFPEWPAAIFTRYPTFPLSL